MRWAYNGLDCIRGPVRADGCGGADLVMSERDPGNTGHQVVIDAEYRFDGLGSTQSFGCDVEVFDAEEAFGRHQSRFADEWQRGPVIFAHPEVLAAGQAHPMVRPIDVAGFSGGQGGLSKGDRRTLRGGIEGSLGLFEEE